MASKKRPKKPTPPAPPVVRAPRAAGRPAGPTRREVERAAAARQERRDALRRRLIAGGLVLVALAAVGAFVLNRQQASAELREALTSGSCEVDTEADTISGGDGHVPAPTYRVNPPAGGDHNPASARSGVYSGASVPADGLLVHSMEHGYILAWHSPDLDDEQKEQLAAFAERHEGDVIVAERPGLPVPVAATAWGHRLLCQEAEPAVLDRFFDAHVGNGPEDVPRG